MVDIGEGGQEGVVVKVAAGFGHSACLTKGGKVFVWGEGHCQGDEVLPREVVMPAGVVIEDLACSNFHTTVISRHPGGGHRSLYVIPPSPFFQPMVVESYAILKPSVSILSEAMSPFTIVADHEKQKDRVVLLEFYNQDPTAGQVEEVVVSIEELGAEGKGMKIQKVCSGVGHTVFLLGDGGGGPVVDRSKGEGEEALVRPYMSRCQEEGNSEYGFL